jgi:hypothetical protein
VEPFRRTLARNAIISVVVATVFALVQRRLWLIGPVALLALWFSLGGHYVEVIFLNGVRPRIPAVPTIQSLVRILIWICGGILLYWGMALTARVLPVRAPSLAFIAMHDLSVDGTYQQGDGGAWFMLNTVQGVPATFPLSSDCSLLRTATWGPGGLEGRPDPRAPASLSLGR